MWVIILLSLFLLVYKSLNSNKEQKGGWITLATQHPVGSSSWHFVPFQIFILMITTNARCCGFFYMNLISVHFTSANANSQVSFFDKLTTKQVSMNASPSWGRLVKAHTELPGLQKIRPLGILLQSRRSARPVPGGPTSSGSSQLIQPNITTKTAWSWASLTIQ